MHNYIIITNIKYKYFFKDVCVHKILYRERKRAFDLQISIKICTFIVHFYFWIFPRYHLILQFKSSANLFSECLGSKNWQDQTQTICDPKPIAPLNRVTAYMYCKYLVVIFDTFIHLFLPSLLLEGGFRVAQFVRMDLDPSHWPFISAMAFSASTFLVKETKPQPLDFSVWGSRTTRQSLQQKRRENKS